MRRNTKVLGAVAAAAFVIAGGSAFTASNTVADSTAGYGTSTVTGATATTVAHTLSGDGATINSTLITFSTSQTGHTVQAGFGTAALQDCAVDATTGTTATCTYATGVATKTADTFNVAVS